MYRTAPAHRTPAGGSRKVRAAMVNEIYVGRTSINDYLSPSLATGSYALPKLNRFAVKPRPQVSNTAYTQAPRKICYVAEKPRAATKPSSRSELPVPPRPYNELLKLMVKHKTSMASKLNSFHNSRGQLAATTTRPESRKTPDFQSD